MLGIERPCIASGLEAIPSSVRSLLVAMPYAPTSFLLLVAMHLFLIANIVTTSKALVTSSDTPMPLVASCYY